MSTTTPQPEARDRLTADAHKIDGDAEYAALRRRSRIFTAVVGGLVMAWFLLLLWAVGYERNLMARTVGGHVTVGLLLAWAQVVTTLLVAVVFRRHSRKNRLVVARVLARTEKDGAA
ncbi:MAG: DUF485 domain-containing protein [Actinoallomurus sp.]